MNLPKIGENHSSHASSYVRFEETSGHAPKTDKRRLPPVCSCITEQTGGSGGNSQSGLGAEGSDSCLSFTKEDIETYTFEFGVRAATTTDAQWKQICEAYRGSRRKNGQL